MFGIIFEGNRDLRRIYMPHDYKASRCARTSCCPTTPHARRAGLPRGAALPHAFASTGEAAAVMTTAQRDHVRSLDDPDIWVETPATIYDAVPPYPPRTEREAEFYHLRDGELLINLGPQHPSTHGVLRIVLKIDGERVVDLDPVMGYLHRGVEKICENGDWHHAISNCDPLGTWPRSSPRPCR